MTTTINASTSSGLVQTADTSGIIKLQSNGVTTNALAWVNFNGTSASPITPRANYNIGSITKNATGDYTLTFTSALSDANYVVIGGAGDASTGASIIYSAAYNAAPTTSACRIAVTTTAGANADRAYVYVAIFGN